MDNCTKNNAAKQFFISHAKGIILAAAALTGCLLLILSGFIQSDGKNAKQSGETTPEDYRLSLEKSLSETVDKIDGAGKTSVMITLECSFETVYASNAKLDETVGQNESGQKTTEKQLATTSSRTDGEAPVIVKKLNPKIKGVLIVCEGGNSKRVKNEVLKAAATALNISEAKIYVTGGNTSS